jgi:SAM-dependent methyltransferase
MAPPAVAAILPAVAVVEDDVGPLPPPELAGYILGSEGSDELVENYRAMGAHLATVLREHLGDRWPRAGARALDFGCGSGRVLRQFARDVGPGELVGCDIDAACIAWVADRLAPVEAMRNDEQPPLPFGDASFDVAWSFSVFPHLTDHWAEWLLELRRVVRPGGRLLISVMGSGASEEIAGEPWDPDRIGMTVRSYARPWAAGGPMILHSEWWLRAHWGRAFDVVAVVGQAAGDQDLVILERPAAPAPSAAALRAPEDGEPRELTAALHAIELAQREHAALNRRHDAYAAAYHAELARRRALERQVGLRAALRSAAQRGLGRLRRRPVTTRRAHDT